MIEKIERFVTSDGIEHETQEKAKTHIVNQMCEYVESKIFNCVSSRKEMTKAVLSLVGEFDNIIELRSKINKIT